MTNSTGPARYASVVPALVWRHAERAEIRFDLSGLSTVLADTALIASVIDLAEDTAESGTYSVTVTDTYGEHSSTCGIDESNYLAERFFPYATPAGHAVDVLCCHTHRTVLVMVGTV